MIYWRSFEQIKYSLLLQFRWLSFPLRSTSAQLDTATDRDLRVVRSARCRGDVQFISSTVSPDDHCHSAWLCFLNRLINDSFFMTHSKPNLLITCKVQTKNVFDDFLLSKIVTDFLIEYEPNYHSQFHKWPEQILWVINYDS